MNVSAMVHSWSQRAAVYADLLRHAATADNLAVVDPAPIMLTCGDDDRGYEVNGRKYAQLLDSLSERLTLAGLDAVTVAIPYSSFIGRKAFGRVISAHGSFARAGVQDRLQRVARRRTTPASSAMVRAWARVLAAVRPVFIIGIQPPPELCIAARQAGIPTADLQHGLLTQEGYYGRGHRERFGQHGWPDRILCWDEPSAKWARARLPATVRASVVGNPWLLRFQRPGSNTPEAQAWRALLPRGRGRPTILVSLQWLFEATKSYHATCMPTALVTAIREGGEDYDWWIRVHPMQLREPARADIFARLKREFGERDNIRWKSCSEAPLPLVLERADLHITSHSAVTLEASCLGIRTAILDERREVVSEWLGPYIAAGTADFVAPRPDAIHSWIAKSLEARLGETRTDFMSGKPLDNFIAEIEQRALGTYEPIPELGAFLSQGRPPHSR